MGCAPEKFSAAARGAAPVPCPLPGLERGPSRETTRRRGGTDRENPEGNPRPHQPAWVPAARGAFRVLPEIENILHVVAARELQHCRRGGALLRVQRGGLGGDRERAVFLRAQIGHAGGALLGEEHGGFALRGGGGVEKRRPRSRRDFDRLDTDPRFAESHPAGAGGVWIRRAAAVNFPAGRNDFSPP